MKQILHKSSNLTADFPEFKVGKTTITAWSHLLQKSLKENFIFCAVLNVNASLLNLADSIFFRSAT